MELKFRPIEKVVNELISKTSSYTYNGWTLHSIGTSSTNKFIFVLVKDGKEKKIEINQFEEDFYANKI